MRHHNENGFPDAMQIEQEAGDGFRRARVEIASGLIAKHEERLADQRASDRHALFFATRQLRGEMIESRRQAHGIE